jgi:hypothetical protein
VVLVIDPTTEAILHELVAVERIKVAGCDEANISKARNIGIGLSAGELVAFIDDDAIAEPTWLERLADPLRDSNIAASGGFVRGRNGISYQWRAEEISADGTSHPVEVDGVTVPLVDPNCATKTQGTNCIFRRDVLLDLNGFDENFHFYLDETDLNLRIAGANLRTAIVPDAEVQHGYAASQIRGKDRRPKSLFEIGASHAYFVKKYGRSKDELDPVRTCQWARLDAALVDGLLEPSDVCRLREDLEAGFVGGSERELLEIPISEGKTNFKPFVIKEGGAPDHVFISSRWIFRRNAFERAKSVAESGAPCTAIILSPTAMYHQRWFHEDGFWVQMGGIFGKSNRSDPLWSWYRREARTCSIRKELEKTRKSEQV